MFKEFEPSNYEFQDSTTGNTYISSPNFDILPSILILTMSITPILAIVFYLTL